MQRLHIVSVTQLNLIQLGKQDVVFAGGAEELSWECATEFDAMGAISTKYNDTPEKASRAYDATVMVLLSQVVVLL